MRILWASNAPFTPTGYGTQTAQVVKRLAQAGHHVAIAANYGLMGTSMIWDEGVPVYPGGLDTYGNDVLPALYRRWKHDGDDAPTLFLTLYDAWVYKNPAFDALPIASWAPVDHVPASPEVVDWARKHATIAMSQFGQRMFEQAGVQAHYVPHAIELDTFHPLPSPVREWLVEGPFGPAGPVPADAFVVMVNAANTGKMPPRKGWAEMIFAFAMFARTHPDAILYLHTDLIGRDAIPLQVLTAASGLTNDQVRVVPQDAYRLGDISQSMLAQLYSTADVLLSTSYGEGFGLAVIEAQACGTPVIVNNVTAQPELCGAGWQVKSQPFWDFTQGSNFGIPIIDTIVSALADAYAHRGDQELRAKAVAFAADYDADRVFERYWVPTLSALERDLLGSPATRQQRRQAQRKQKR